MTDEALVERLAGVLWEHAYVPSGLRGVSKCGCGVQMHGMPHDHRAHVAAELAAVVREVEAVVEHYANCSGGDGLVGVRATAAVDCLRRTTVQVLHRGDAVSFVCEWLDGGTRQVEWPTEELTLTEAQRLTGSGVKFVVVWEMDDVEETQ